MSHRPVLKAIGRALVGALLFNAISPLSVIAQDKPQVSPAAQRQLQQYAQLNQKIEQAKADKARSPSDQAAEHLKKAQDAAAALRADQRARAAPAGDSKDQRELRAIGPNVKVEVQRAQALNPERRAEHASKLKEHLQGVREGQAAVRAELDATGRELQKKNQPSVILERQQLALAQFDQRSRQFEQLSQAWLKDPSDANLGALAEFFEQNPAQRKAAPFDAKKLPWSSPKPTTRTPAETKAAWFQQLWGTEKIRTAQSTSVGPITFQIPPEPGQAPTEADLAVSAETQRTPAIVAKAAELNKNPLAIHLRRQSRSSGCIATRSLIFGARAERPVSCAATSGMGRQRQFAGGGS